MIGQTSAGIHIGGRHIKRAACRSAIIIQLCPAFVSKLGGVLGKHKERKKVDAAISDGNGSAVVSPQKERRWTGLLECDNREINKENRAGWLKCRNFGVNWGEIFRYIVMKYKRK